MREVGGMRRKAAVELANHSHVCDLVRMEFPAASLYTDGRISWIYLWCDTNGKSRDRWLLFPVGRDPLTKYFRKELSLRDLVINATRRLVLDIDTSDREEDSSSQRSGEPHKPRRLLREVVPSDVDDYIPTAESFFDPALTDDVDLTEEIMPHGFDVPISGDWFERDFEQFFKRYRRLYAFFYATRPRFVKTLAHKLSIALRAPWTGGYSRLNLYNRLSEDIPGIHTLRIQKLQYASPGDVRFEALPEIGESIGISTLRYLEYEISVNNEFKNVHQILTRANLNKLDTSGFSDAILHLSKDSIAEIVVACERIAAMLNVHQEMEHVRAHSPNTAVYAKAVLSFVRQVEMLSALQRQGMLDFSEPESPY